ncbi:MAG: hypothetical protein IJO43_02360 [Bacilli bacterium]|nr:hypothetical protein [Bacilli bacterium]
MQNLIRQHRNKINISLLLLSPVIVAVCNVCLVSIFNLGNYTGTFLRYLFQLVVS